MSLAVSHGCRSIDENEAAADAEEYSKRAPHYFAAALIDFILAVGANVRRRAPFPLLGKALLALVLSAHHLVAASLLAVVIDSANEDARVRASSDAAHSCWVLHHNDLRLLHDHDGLSILINHLLLHHRLTWLLHHLDLSHLLCLNDYSWRNLVRVHRGKMCSECL